jgi:Protein of unknown function (DUF4038)
MTDRIEGRVGVPVEVELGRHAGDVIAEVEVSAGDSESMRIPAFQRADGRVAFRFAAPAPGAYEFSVVDGGPPARGSIDVASYDGPNPIYRHGRLRVASDRRSMEHADGTPFLWFGDTWWMGLAKRLDWPDGFRHLLADRVEKGFSVIQIVAGPLPDFGATPEGIWHPQQANDGGWSWDPGWARLNPAYFDDADRRIAAIADAGIVPCIVGMWGYYEHVMGPERIKRHWREIVARYAAYPVVFCVAGEVNLAGYDFDADRDLRDDRRQTQLRTWTEVAREVHSLDPYGNPVTAHPASPDARSLLDDPAVLDVNMVQTSHWSYHPPPEPWRRDLGRDLGLDEPLRMGFVGMLSIVRDAVAQAPPIPVINAEPSYEGILGGNWQDVQRFDFWTCWLTGLAGYTYGADGIWQMSSDAEAFANQVSRWGNASWQRAMHYEGGLQVAAGVRLLRELPWWTLRPVSVTRAEAAGRVAPFGAANDELSIHYLPSILLEERLRGMRDLPVDVPAGGRFARWIDPSTMTEHVIGPVEPAEDGTWQPPEPPTYADWLLLVGTEAT